MSRREFVMLETLDPEDGFECEQPGCRETALAAIEMRVSLADKPQSIRDLFPGETHKNIRWYVCGEHYEANAAVLKGLS